MEKELILCDTNILISWFRGEFETNKRLENIGSFGMPLALDELPLALDELPLALASGSKN